MTATRAAFDPAARAGPPVVCLEHVSVSFGGLMALEDVSLRIDAGERVALVGPSGAGKSTLLGLCRATVAPSSGKVEIQGRDVSRLQGRQLRRVRGAIGTVHQQLHLAGRLRVVHNVNAGRLGSWTRRQALWSLLRPQAVDVVVEALTQVGIADKVQERTDQLSGGEQQRVALARVLVQDPALVLADEPVSSLDPVRGREVMDLLRDVGAGHRSLIVSLHAFELALTHCDRVIGLRAGRIVFDSPAAAVTDTMAAELYRIGP